MPRLPLVLLLLAATVTAAAPPHILVFLTDDLSARDVGAYGATDVRTPTIDQLAAEGLTFDRAFILSPACAPSRAALLTGLTPVHNGARANHTYPRDDVPSLIQHFTALGYQTAAFGKVAHGKDADRHGFDHLDRSIDPEHIADWLEQRDATRPVALFVGTHAPHVPWPANQGYDPAEIIVPAFHIDTPDTRLFRARYYTDVTAGDADFAATRRVVSAALGAEADLLTVFSADHGAQWPFGKWSLYDEGIRVPLIISWPGRITPAIRSAAMVNWNDLLPTLIDLAGGDVPPGLDGASFAAVTQRPATPHRERIFTLHDNDGRANVYPIRSVRTERWKYIRNLHPDWIHSDHSYRFRKDDAGAYWWSWDEAAKTDHRAALIVNRFLQRPGEELYDLAVDPDELNNLAADPRHATSLGELRAELDRWMNEQGDDGQVEPAPWLPGQSDLLSPQSAWPPHHP